MRKLKYFTFIIMFTCICILCLVFVVGCLLYVHQGTLHSVNETFENDKNKLYVISDYFKKSHHNNIYISSSMKSGEMLIEGVPDYMQDPKIIRTIDELKNKGYKVIGKSGNTVYFQIWSNANSGKGIAHSINGKTLQLEFLIKNTPLSEDYWYYYEEDYDAWKNENTTDGIPNYILGEWSIQYAKTRDAGVPGEEYPLEELYNEETLHRGVKIVFNSDGTFVKTVSNPLLQNTTTQGNFILRYDNKILLKHNDGEQSTVRYLAESEEIVYYTIDSHSNPIDEYYKK